MFRFSNFIGNEKVIGQVLNAKNFINKKSIEIMYFYNFCSLSKLYLNI